MILRNIRTFFFLVIIITVIGCHQKDRRFRTLDDINYAFQHGNLTLVTQWADSILIKNNSDSASVSKLRSLIDMADRIRIDFTLSEEEIRTELKTAIGNYSENDKALWEKNNWLEFRLIDGRKQYFKRAVSNLKLILARQQTKQRESSEMISNPFSQFCLDHIRQVIRADRDTHKPVLPVKMRVHYQLTVFADAVPDGEMVRCWLPWPRELHDRQKHIVMVKTVPVFHLIAPDSLEQRSVFLEQKAVKGQPVKFEMQFEYESFAQYFDLRTMKPSPMDTVSSLFKKYTSEQYPQIVFTDQIKHLSDSLVQDISNPAEKVRNIYYWINDHIIWTGALEYSIIPFIPGYVLSNRRGDCGMQTLLFMAMARYQGIPVKWQSGWMMHPGKVNLHDWCEVYYNGIGWVPLDMSFNLQNSKDLREREFYIQGIDAYRLIINDGISSRLMPDKKKYRSEPYDFQRGEVEWKGGNLYFNKWDYHMQVEYF